MVGCGNMGGALLARWLDDDQFTFTAVSPSGRQMPAGVEVVTDADALGGKTFDIIVIGVKPQMIADVMPTYVERLANGGMFLSMAAGFSAASLENIIGHAAMIRVMPNMPVRVGKGVSALYANGNADKGHRRQIEALMATTGELIWVDTEDQMDRFTAIAGSGPGYVFEIARCYVKAAESLGFSTEESRAMVLQTIAGAIEMAFQSEDSLETLRNSVTSKNGATAAGLAALNGDQMLDSRLQSTVDAAYARTVELR